MTTALQLSGQEIARRAMESPTQRSVDRMAKEMLARPQQDCPLEHHFTPGLYYRRLFVPAKTLGVTKIHQTEHPMVIAQGKLSIWDERNGVQQVEAPFIAVTKPGTRRVFFTHSDIVWLTFHATDKTDVKELEDWLFYDPETDDIPIEVAAKLTEDAA